MEHTDFDTTKIDYISVPEIEYSVSYPTGERIKTNIKKFKKLAFAFNKIEKYKGKNINLFAQGTSGTVGATVFSEYVENKVSFYPIRKHLDERTNDFNKVGNIYTFDASSDINVFIDDWVSSGQTIEDVHAKVLDANKNLKNFKIHVLIFGGIFNYTDGMSDNINPDTIIAKSISHSIKQVYEERYDSLNGIKTEKKVFVDDSDDALKGTVESFINASSFLNTSTELEYQLNDFYENLKQNLKQTPNEIYKDTHKPREMPVLFEPRLIKQWIETDFAKSTNYVSTNKTIVSRSEAEDMRREINKENWLEKHK